MRYLFTLFICFIFLHGAKAQLPVVNLGNDTVLCQGSSLVLQAGNPGASYLWSTGQTSQSITALSTGQYWVQVTNVNGSARDTVQVQFLAIPSLNRGDTTVCSGQVRLPVGGDADVVWWWPTPSGGNPLSNSNPWQTNLSSSQTYYVQGWRLSNAFYNAPPLTNGIGTTTFLLRNDRGQIFNALQNLTLYAVWVYVQSSNSSNVSFTIRLQNSSGGQLRSQALSLPAGFHRVVLNWPVAQGNGYRLIANGISSNGTLSINTGVSAQYPFTVAGVLSITGDFTNATAPFSVGNYNYFYNWEILLGGFCASARQPVQLTVLNTPVLNFPSDTLSCAGGLVLNAGNVGASYVWSTGETSQSISLSQSQVVAVTASNGQCSAADTVNVLINNTPVLQGLDTSVCSGPLTLRANGNANAYFWWTAPTGGSLRQVGSTYSYNTQANDTFYVEAWNVTGAVAQTGAADNTFAAGSSLLRNNRGLVFNAVQPFRLYSVRVYVQSSNSSNVSFNIRLFNSSGQQLQTRALSLAAGVHEVVLNWLVPVGTGHRIIADGISANGSLFLNTAGNTPYPYTVPGVVEITGDYTNTTAPFGVGNYNYFYHWIIYTGGACLSTRQPYRVQTTLSPQLNLPNDTLACGTQCVLNATNVGASYVWSTGETTATVTVQQDAQVWVRVQRGICVANDTVNVLLEPVPSLSVRDTTVCSGQTALNVGGNADVFLWWSAASGGSLLGVGNPLAYAAASSSTLYAEGINLRGAYHEVGLPNQANFSASYLVRNDRGLEFDAQQAITLYAVRIFAQGSTSFRIALQNSSGATLLQQNVTVPNGSSELVLNWPIAAGLGYRLVASNITGGSLLITSGVNTFPYAVPGVMSIRQDFPVFNNYNYFYAWKIFTGPGSCSSGRMPSQVAVIPTPQLSFPSDTLICQSTYVLDAGNAGASYVWSTGSSTQSITASTAGQYRVTVTRSICQSSDTINLRYHQAPSVQVRDTTLCGGLVNLAVTGDADEYYWWSDHNRSLLLGVGNPFQTNLWDSTTFYVSGISAPGGFYRGGLASNGLDGGSYLLRNDRGLIFDVQQQLVLRSVKMYAQGNPSFSLRLLNANGAVLQQRTVVLNQAETEVFLDWNILPGQGYQLIATGIVGGLLYINGPLINAPFPYDVPGVLTIREDVPLFGNYNFFYDWKIAVGGYCVNFPNLLQAQVLPTPRFFLPADTIACGSSLVLDAQNSGASFIWSTGQTSNSITVSQSGSYGVSASLGSCSNSQQINVVLTTPPTMLILPNDTTVCGGNIQLHASGDAYTYAWYNQASGGTPILYGDTVLFNLSDTTAFWVEGLGFLLQPNFYGETSLGVQGAGAYINPTGGPYPDQGLEFDALSPFTLNQVSVFVTGAGTATVVLEDQFGFVVESRTVSFTAAGEQIINLNWLIQPQNGYKLLLTNLVGTSAYVRNNYSFPISYPMLRINRGEPAVLLSRYAYFFKWRISTPSCPTPRQTVQVNIPPYPSFVMPMDTALCGQSSLSLAATANNPNYSYGWSNGQTTNVMTALASGSYAVTVVNNGLCARSQNILIQLLDLPADPNIADTSVCAPGQYLLLQAQPNAVYQWYDQAGGGISYLGAPRRVFLADTALFRLRSAAKASTRLGLSQHPNPSTATTYSSFRIPNSFNTRQWTSLDSVAVYVDRAPASFYLRVRDSLNFNTVLFEGWATVQQARTKQFVPLGISLAPGAYTLEFDSLQNLRFLVADGLATYPASSSAAVASLSGTNIAGTNYPCFYDWHFSYALGSCLAPNMDSFNVDMRLPLNLPSSLFSCDSLVVDAQLPAGSTYQWSNGQSTSSLTLTQAGAYALTVSDGGNCQAVDSFVFQQPTPLELPNDGGLCGNVLSSNYTQGNFFWSTGDLSSSISIPDTGRYALTVQTPSGCILQDSVWIQEIVNIPNINLGLDRRVCLRDTLDAGFVGPQVSYAWNTGANTRQIIVNQDGNYAVTVSLAPYGCTASDTVSIGIDTLPRARFSYVVSGQAVGFTNTSTAGTTNRWDFGDGNLSSQRSPIRAYAQAGCYRVELIVFGNCGSDTTVQWVSVGGVQPCPVIISQVVAEAEDLSLWPNPNQGQFSLRLPFVPSRAWSYALFNAQGQMLYQSAALWSQEQVLEHSDLVPGLYWLRVQTERGERSIKWIRQE